MFDRRSFVQHSAVIAAAMAALRETTPLHAAEPEPKKPISANEKLRVAVVGVNGRGMSHVGGFTDKLGCEIVTICDVDSAVIGQAMNAVEKRTGKKPKFEQDVRKVLEDKSIDIVSFATPNHWHALGAVWAMRAGKDVYVEKPASHNFTEGRKMVQAARKYKRLCQVGTQSRSTQGMRQSIQYIHDGNIGKVSHAYGTCYKRRGSIGKVSAATPPPKTIDYDLWCGPAPMEAVMRKRLHYDWHWQWDFGNGDLGNQGVHEMDKARWGLNKKELPKSVVSLGGRFGYIDDGQTANTQLCIFDYGDSELIFEVRGLSSESPFPAVFNGKAGSNFVGNIWYGDKGFVVCPSYSSGVVLDPDLKVVAKFSGGGDEGHFGNFVKAVRSRKVEDLNCDIEEGHQSAALCHLANVSYRLGQAQKLSEVKEVTGTKKANETLAKMINHLKENNVDLEKTDCLVGPKLTLDASGETIAGNNAALPLLTRNYRKGFDINEAIS